MSLKRRRTEGDGPGNADTTAPQNRRETRKLAAACSACRKQKIRCELQDDEPPCARCHRRGLDCVLHQPMRPPNADLRQLGLLRKDVTALYETLISVCEQVNVDPPPLPLSSYNESTQSNDARQRSGVDAEDDETVCELSPPLSPSAAQAPMDTFLGTARADGVSNWCSPRSARKQANEVGDLISRGLITLDTARYLVDRYLNRLDHFLYGLARRFDDVEAVLKASPVLLAAMCAVAAFNDPEQQGVFEVCNKAYRELVSASLFEKKDSEHIRALCIGSFWLPDASRILLSDAHRRAADARLPYCFHKLMAVKDNHTPAAEPSKRDEMTDKVRLWYLLFISDQHLSILHNRDSVARREIEILESREAFLAASTTTNQDVRLMSQVSLLLIMGQVRDIFGSEVSSPVSKALKVQFVHFSGELDHWFSKYAELFEPDPIIGNFPISGLQLHYQFGKVYLGHHVFRGLKEEPIPIHFLPTATMAYTAARAIFQLTLHNEAFRDNLLGVPHYFHVMMSFAGHFMLEVCGKHHDQLGINIREDLDEMKSALAHCKRISALPLHPLSRMTAGLLRKLSEFTTNTGLDMTLDGSPFQKLDQLDTNGAALAQMPAAFLPDLLGPYSMPNDMDGLDNTFFPQADLFGFHDNLEYTYLA